jgi:hypothetical protein
MNTRINFSATNLPTRAVTSFTSRPWRRAFFCHTISYFRFSYVLDRFRDSCDYPSHYSSVSSAEHGVLETIIDGRSIEAFPGTTIAFVCTFCSMPCWGLRGSCFLACVCSASRHTYRRRLDRLITLWKAGGTTLEQRECDSVLALVDTIWRTYEDEQKAMENSCAIQELIVCSIQLYFLVGSCLWHHLFGTLLPPTLNTPSGAPLCSYARIALATRNQKNFNNSLTLLLVAIVPCLLLALMCVALVVSISRNHIVSTVSR